MSDPLERAVDRPAHRTELDRLRAALAEADREKKSIRDTCVALNKHNDELDARLDEALARADRAEAALTVAWEVIKRAVAWCDDFDIDDAWTKDARAFLERAATDTDHRPQSAAE